MATTNALARDAEIVNALAPESSNSNPYIDSLISKATQEYPFISQHKPVVAMGAGEGYAQTWPPGEGGPPDEQGKDTRPTALPMDRLGIEIYRPNDFNHHALAGEVLHVDPYAREVSDKLATTFDPRQLEVLKREALDYQHSLNTGQDEKRAIQNATDAAVRGYVVNQWPEEVNQEFAYSPVQKALLESLKGYAKTGKKP
jgi:hypothetical protein